MKRKTRGRMKRSAAAGLAVMLMFSAAACGGKEESVNNLIKNEKKDKKVVNLFGPMEKSNPNAKNIARSAFDLTIAMASPMLTFWSYHYKVPLSRCLNQ